MSLRSSIALGGSLFAALCFLVTGASSRAAGESARAVLAAGAAAIGTVPTSGGLRETGTLSTAGASGTFESWLNLSNGYSAASYAIGPLSGASGYDGASWTASNGITGVDNMPATQAQNVTTVYLALDRWASPADADAIADLGLKTAGAKSYRVIRIVPSGGVPALLWFDPSAHLLARTDIEADSGVVTDRLSDYQTVSGYRIAYRDENQQGGAKTVSVVKTAAIGAVPVGALARTPSVERGSLTGSASEATVPFRFNLGDTGNIVLPVSFGKNDAVATVFDTGGRNLLSPQAAQTLGFTGGGGLDVGGVGASSVRAKIANVGTVAIGAARLADQQAFVVPLPYGLTASITNGPVEGLVGLEMLQNFQTTIDYAKQTMTFASFDTPAAVPKDATILPTRTDGRIIYVEAAIDGVKGLFMVDTGNSGDVILFKTFADAHHLFAGKKSLAYVSEGGLGGTLPYRNLRATNLVLAGTVLDGPIVEVTDQKTGALASRSIAGNIGASVLRRFTVQINDRDGTVAFAANSRVSDPFLADRTGLSLARDAEAFIVLAVTPGTPAAEAGMKVHDRIVAIDGTPATSISGGQIYRATHDPGVKKVVLSVVRAGDAAPLAVTIVPRTLR